MSKAPHPAYNLSQLTDLLALDVANMTKHIRLLKAAMPQKADAPDTLHRIEGLLDKLLQVQNATALQTERGKNIEQRMANVEASLLLLIERLTPPTL